MPEFRHILELPRRLFVVGDIHGCLGEASMLLEYLRKNEALAQEDQVVFVGDYIDRGLDSKEVVDHLLKFGRDFPGTVFLKGNHEDMFLAFLGFEGHLGLSYVANGGLQALESYGFFGDVMPEQCLSELPHTHLNFFQNLERGLIIGKYVIVHAGLSPLADLQDQNDEDLFWIRDEFIANVHHFDKTVIFGHTPFRDLMFDLPYKIGVDTGLIYGNKLTCIELVNGVVFQVPRGSRRMQVSTFEDKGG